MRSAFLPLALPVSLIFLLAACGHEEAAQTTVRPAMVAGVLGLVALAFIDPPRYSAGMAALSGTPWPVWALAAIIIALHFLTKSGAAPRAETART